MSNPDNELERRALRIATDLSESESPVAADQVAGLCEGDPTLMAIVGELLESNKLATEFLDNPAHHLAIDLPGEMPTTDEGILPVVDGYEIKSELGRGGMGSVFLAHDPKLRRDVAIKLVRFGAAIPDYARRLKKEAYLLARLHHPNIASVVSADVTRDGVPYYVMEFVDGLPIDVYCDQNHLSINKRLAIFRDICAAVQHAHQRLVIHRDLKPSNILVTSDGTAKLLDFGIAKLLDSEGIDTQTQTAPGRELLTPSYASPEQRLGQPVTTASDVFSLGVILHELLTGRKPARSRVGYVTRPSMSLVDDATSGDLLAIARSRSSSSPRLKKMLAGDLDNICIKALEVDPDQRYQSAQQLLDDLTNLVQGRPVFAKPPSRIYRFRKFVGRNKIAVAGSTIALVAILGLSAAATWQASVARAESVRSTRVKSFLVDIFRASDPAYQSSIDSLTARDILDRGYKRVITEFENEPEIRLDLLSELSSIYLNQGAGVEAGRLSRLAIEERRVLYPNDRRALAAELLKFGGALHLEGKTDSAIIAQTEALEIAREIKDDALKATATTSLSNIYHLSGDIENSRDLADESIDLFEKIGFADTTSSMNHARALRRVGLKLAFAGTDSARAFKMLRRSVDIYEREVGPNNPQTIDAMATLGTALIATDQIGKAVAQYQDVLARTKIQFGPTDASMSYAFWDLGHALKLAKQYDQSAEMLGRSIEIDTNKYGPKNPSVLSARLQRAEVYRLSGDLDAALVEYDEIIPLFEPTILYQPLGYLNRGEIFVARGEWNQALADLDRALIGMTSIVGPDSYRLADILIPTAYAQFQVGNRKGALESATRAKEVRESRTQELEGRLAIARIVLGAMMIHAGQTDEGSRLVQENMDAAVARQGDRDLYTIFAKEALTSISL